MQPVSRPVSNPSATDPVIETQVFWMKYRMHLVAGLLALIVGLAVYGGYRYMTQQRENAAAQALASAKTAADYEKVIADYSSAPAVPSAYLLLAEAQRKEQKLAEANTSLQKFIGKYPKHELTPVAKMSMAGNLESLGKADEALELYRRIAAEHPRSFVAPQALLGQVHLLKQKGQTEEARRACETVLTQYRETYASQQATQYLRMLKPPAPAPAAQPVGTPAPAATP